MNSSPTNLPRLLVYGLAGFFGLVLFFMTFGVIDTGNVGVRRTLGVISESEVAPGIYAKWPLISSVREFTARETAIDLTDLTPKTKDNLSLQDMDVTVFYSTSPAKITELETKYSGQSGRDDAGNLLSAYGVILRVARNAAYEEVAKVDSLVMHTRREQIGAAIRSNIQAKLDVNDPGTFHVTRVVLRSVVTDLSIEESIRTAVANQKKLEAMNIQTEIAKKQAEIRVTEADGIAKANRIISGSLTREYLQHETNQALQTFAEKGNSNTVIVPANMATSPLINIPTGPAAK